MADFHFTIASLDGDTPAVVADEIMLLGFRFYERLSGMDPTLDRPKSELRGLSPDDPSPASPFDDGTAQHAPAALNHESRVQPPYYARVLVSPSVLPADLKPDDLLGRPACLAITDDTGPNTRYVRGLVLRVLDRNGPFGRSSALEFQVYPWLWALSLSEKSRVWLDVDSATVLQQLVAEYRREFSDHPRIASGGLAQRPNPREAVVQWDESDFEFVSRLLERDGLYYYFVHEEAHTQIHLADWRSLHADGYLPHRALTLQPTLQPGSELFDDHLSFLTTRVQTLPDTYRVADYNPMQAQTPVVYGIPTASDSAREIYDYPGGVATLGAVPGVARRRHAAMTAHRRTLRGASRCPFVAAGHGTTLPPLESEEEARPVRVLQAVHELVRDEAGKPFYRNWFEAIDGDVPYAPTQRTPVPAVQGTHNATVVSRLPRENVDVDEHSRALVVFQWDRARTPVRARLGQPWAGGRHGMNVLPRHGDEVLVGFIQGNSEQPVILTALHNSSTPKKFNPTHMAPHDVQGLVTPGPERQNRYATAIHNATGNALYFNDTSDHEIVKLDAYKDFILEIGHKVKGSIDSPDDKQYAGESNIGGADRYVLSDLFIEDPGRGYQAPFTINNIAGKDGEATVSLGSEGEIAHVSITVRGTQYTMDDDDEKVTLSDDAVPKDNGIKKVGLKSGGTFSKQERDQGTLWVDSAGGQDAQLSATFSNDAGITAITVDHPGYGYAANDVVYYGPAGDKPNAKSVGTISELVVKRQAVLKTMVQDTAMDTETGGFLSEKEKRGSGLIRSYGDLTIYVGKFRETEKEFPASEHQREEDQTDAATIEDQEERGDYNLFVMGGTSSATRGGFAYVTHPKDGAFIEASYAAKSLFDDRIKAQASRGNSVDAHAGRSAGMSGSAGFDASLAFSSSMAAGASIGFSGGASVDASLDFFKADLSESNLDIESVGGKLGVQSGKASTNAAKIILATDPAGLITEQALNTKMTTALKVVEGILTGAAATACTVLSSLAGHGDKDNAKEHLQNSLPKLASSLHLASATCFSATVAAGILLAIKRKVGEESTQETAPSIEMDALTGIKINTGPSSSLKITKMRMVSRAQKHTTHGTSLTRNVTSIIDKGSSITQQK